MTDQDNNPQPHLTPEEHGAIPGSPRVIAFCQQCGKPLMAGNVHPVGAGIYCQPCAAQRQNSAGAREYAPVNAPPMPGMAPPRRRDEPNPVLAGVLGLVPGVGAMYNGQFAKAVVHLVIFVVLTSLADNLNWVLWWLVWGWIFYQGFEAYHTAQARRDGLPLPDPFGWNDLGERLGFARSGASPTTRVAPEPPVPPSARPPVSSPASPVSDSSVEAPPAYTASASADTNSATAFTPIAAAAASSSPSPATSSSSSSFDPAYRPIYTGGAPPPAAAAETSDTSGFPPAAVWLIALGLLFLAANLAPDWHIQARWLIPGVLALLALWSGGRRLTDGRRPAAPGSKAASLAKDLLGPALLLTVAGLLALQSAGTMTLRHSWPILLIVWGAFLLIGRAAGNHSVAADSAVDPFPGYPDTQAPGDLAQK